MGLDWLDKKSACSAGELRAVVEPGHTDICVRRQCEVQGVNRSAVYYGPHGESAESLKLMRLIDEEYTRQPSYCRRRMRRWLREQG